MEDTTKAQVLRQVEFYFGDSNFPRDRFLRDLAEKNTEGWVAVSEIASFTRMKKITEDLEVIVAALRESKQLEVSEDGVNIRRIAPLPVEDDSDNRSVYIKGFPNEMTLDDVFAWLEESGIKYKCVRMRRIRESKAFKGSVFVEFETVEEAAAVSKREDLKYKETPMVKVAMKLDYLEGKKKERMEKRAAKEALRKMREEEDAKKEEESFTCTFPEGCLLKIEGVPADSDFIAVKELLMPHGVAFVEKNGDTAYFARFKTVEEAEKGMEAAKDLKIGEASLTATVVTGEDHLNYCKTVTEARRGRAKRKREDGGGRRGRGGRGGKGRPTKRARKE